MAWIGVAPGLPGGNADDASRSRGSGGAIAATTEPRPEERIALSEHVRKVLEAFAQSHDPRHFSEDAVYTQMAPSQSFHGRDEIAGMLRLFYAEAFSDAAGELRNVAVDTDKDLGMIEFVFRGRHTGPLMGIAPTGRSVEVPMVAVYELGDGTIDRARLYYDMATFMRQLGQMP
jgi:steroid delta-isomerase-like uncharacterized protein